MNSNVGCASRKVFIFIVFAMAITALSAVRSESQTLKSVPVGMEVNAAGSGSQTIYGNTSGIEDSPTKGSIKLDLQVDEDSSVFTKTVMVTLTQLDAAEVEPFVRKSLSKFGSVSVNSQANLLVITDREPKLSDLVAFVMDMDKLGMENFVRLETEVIKLNNVQASSLVNILKQRLSSEGLLQSDDSLNVLVVTDVRGKIDYVKSIIEQLDLPPEQIIIEAKIVQVSDTDFSDVGIDLTSLLDMGNLAAGVDYDSLKRVTGQNNNNGNEYIYNDKQRNKFSSLSGSNTLSEVVNMMVGTGKAKLIANPRIVTLNNKAGSISIQSNENYRSSSSRVSINNGQNGYHDVSQSGYEKAFPNMQLTATPQIGAGGRITIDFKVSVFAIDDPGKDANSYNNGLDKTIESTIIVKQGESFVVGGLNYDMETAVSRKTPLLSSLPFIGNVFTKKIKKTTKSQVLFFITPKILKTDTNPPTAAEKALGSEQ